VIRPQQTSLNEPAFQPWSHPFAGTGGPAVPQPDASVRHRCCLPCWLIGAQPMPLSCRRGIWRWPETTRDRFQW